MTIKKIEITEDANQEHILLLDNDNEVTIELRFFETTQSWAINVTYLNKEVKGVILSQGANILKNNNLPFTFILDETPFFIDDFTSNRCSLYINEI